MSMFNLFKPSPQQVKVNEATDTHNLDDDWKAYLQISDEIRIAPDGGKKILKAILKNAQNKDQRVACFALTLLGSCVANDDIGRFHDVVATEETMSVMMKLGRQKSKGEVREKALVLIRKWAEAFSSVGRYPIFKKKYRMLMDSGVVFPMPDEAPVLTPQASHDTNPNAAQDPKKAPDEKGAFTANTPQYIQKLKNDLVALHSYVNTCRGILKPISTQYKGRKVENHEILIQMNKPMIEIQTRLNELIASLGNEELVDLTIKLSEEVYQTVEWMAAIEQGRESKGLQPSALPKRLNTLQPTSDESNGEVKQDTKEGKTGQNDTSDGFGALARRRMETKDEKDPANKPAPAVQGDILGLFEDSSQNKGEASTEENNNEPSLDELFSSVNTNSKPSEAQR